MRIPLLFLALSLNLAAPWSASAQPATRWRDFRRAAQRPSDYLKNNEQIKGLLTPVVATAAAATVRVSCDGRQVALGTVVAADGLILTKASQLADKPECRLADGRKLPAKVVGTDEATDLALLRVDAKNLTPVVWTDPPAPGSIVAATAPGGEPLAIGAISDVPQAMPGPTRDNRQHGWLGISVAPIDDGSGGTGDFARQRRRESRTAKRRSHQAAGRRGDPHQRRPDRQAPRDASQSRGLAHRRAKGQRHGVEGHFEPLRRAVWSRTIGAAAPSATAAGGLPR